MMQHGAQRSSVYVGPSEQKVKPKHAKTVVEQRHLIYGQTLYLKGSAGGTISTSFLGLFVQYSI